MKEKRLIVSMAMSGKSRVYANFTHPLIAAYARACDADFLAIHQPDGDYPSPGFYKWNYTQLLERYHRILHIDADAVVKPTTPNLFEMVPYGHFAGVDELPYQDEKREYPFVDRVKDMEKMGGIPSPIYINVGVFLFDNTHSQLFSQPPRDDLYFCEQSQINYALNQGGYPITLLPPSFNFTSLIENSGMAKKHAYIIHYAGNWRGHSDEEILRMMRDDL